MGCPIHIAEDPVFHRLGTGVDGVVVDHLLHVGQLDQTETVADCFVVVVPLHPALDHAAPPVGLFVVGVNAEGDTHNETTEAAEHNQPKHDETDEEAEVAADGGHDEPAEAAKVDEQTATAADEGGEDERVLGMDLESPAAVVAAVVVSLATPGRIPVGTTRTLVRLHTPERVALARSRVRD